MKVLGVLLVLVSADAETQTSFRRIWVGHPLVGKGGDSVLREDLVFSYIPELLCDLIQDLRTPIEKFFK